MIEYKRFISYIYAYAGGVRDKNTGFAKAQVQGQKFELAINLRGVYTDTPEYMNVSFVMQKEENKSKYRLLVVGRILVNNGIGSYMGVFNAENIENSGFEFSDICGIAITKENDTYYMMSSMWQDDEINENNIEFLPKGYNKNLQMKQAGDEAATPQTTEQSPQAEIEQVGDSVINTSEQQKNTDSQPQQPLQATETENFEIQEILDGNVISGQLKTCCDMGKKASFEERFTVTEMLLEAVTERISVFQKIDEKTEKLYENLKLLKIFLQEKNSVEAMEQFVASRRKALDAKICSELLTAEEAAREEEQIRILEEYFFQLKELHISDVAEGIEQIGERFGNVCRLRNEKLKETKKMLEQAFSFLEECFGEGQELLLFETGLTGDDRCSIFISQYGCPSYFKHCELLLYSKKENEMRKECRDLLEE